MGEPDSINTQFGYMFICYVNEDIQVYTSEEEPVSLAAREHTQKLYVTKQPIVTDSSVAGADGVTLNYTVVAPLFQDGVMAESLFRLIYSDDTAELLRRAASANQNEAVLIGSKGQIMSSTSELSYSSSYVDQLQDVRIYSITTDTLETRLLARESGVLYSGRDRNPMYTAHGPIKNTNWDILITIDFFCLLSAMLPHPLLIAAITAAVTLSLCLLVRACNRQ